MSKYTDIQNEIYRLQDILERLATRENLNVSRLKALHTWYVQALDRRDKELESIQEETRQKLNAKKLKFDAYTTPRRARAEKMTREQLIVALNFIKEPNWSREKLVYFYAIDGFTGDD